MSSVEVPEANIEFTQVLRINIVCKSRWIFLKQFVVEPALLIFKRYEEVA